MEENILQPQPSFKLYKDRAIYVGTFLGGPLVAGYLAAENFGQLGQTDKKKITWIIAVCATVVVFGSAIFIPGLEKVPNYVIPLIYTGIAHLLVNKYQGAALKTHIEAGGQTFSTWRAVWIGLVGLVILLGVIVALVALSGTALVQ